MHLKNGYNLLTMISEFINGIFNGMKSVPFGTLTWIVWGSFAGIFALTLILCFVSQKLRGASKRPYLCFVNAYSAVTLATFLTEQPLPQSVLAAALFWCAGYLTYGLLCAITKTPAPRTAAQLAVTSLPAATAPALPVVRADVPAAKSSVRLEHAISVTDKLLKKNLGKSDRQELEKLKNTLAVLQMKGTLSTAEADILNDNFNALLKLMAKYNV